MGDKEKKFDVSFLWDLGAGTKGVFESENRKEISTGAAAYCLPEMESDRSREHLCKGKACCLVYAFDRINGLLLEERMY